MSLASKVAECAAAYEQECGKHSAELVPQIAEQIQNVSKMLMNLGRKTAQQGKRAYSTEVFPALVAEIFRLDLVEDHETVQAVANLWQSDYMNGYNAGETEYYRTD